MNVICPKCRQHLDVKTKKCSCGFSVRRRFKNRPPPPEHRKRWAEKTIPRKPNSTKKERQRWNKRLKNIKSPEDIEDE